MIEKEHWKIFETSPSQQLIYFININLTGGGKYISLQVLLFAFPLSYSSKMYLDLSPPA